MKIKAAKPIGIKRIVVLTVLATAFGVLMDYWGVVDWIANEF